MNHGPVLYGTDWLSGMDKPNATGEVRATGSVRGGHCYYGNGDLKGDDAINSWGATWAVKGHFWMPKTDMTKLQASQGEAWAAVVAA
jgi:hypothetical protein